jgi:hypothetical protein
MIWQTISGVKVTKQKDIVLNPETNVRAWKGTETSAYIEHSRLNLRIPYKAPQGRVETF